MTAAFQQSFFDKVERSLQERFERFDRDNPKIFEALVSIARRWKDAGRTHCSVDFLMHILRWETGLRGDEDPWKINNDYAARYARKIVAFYPEFDGFFAMRRLTAV
jgi:hypothetical protein